MGAANNATKDTTSLHHRFAYKLILYAKILTIQRKLANNATKGIHL